MLKPKIEALQVRSEYIQAKAFIASIDMAQINEGIAILGKVINGESVPTASLKVVVKATEKLRHLPSKLLVFVKNNIDMIDTIDDHLAQAGILNRLPVEVKNILPELKGHVAQAINMLETSNAQIDSLLAQAKAELQRQFMGW